MYLSSTYGSFCVAPSTVVRRHNGDAREGQDEGLCAGTPLLILCETFRWEPGIRRETALEAKSSPPLQRGMYNEGRYRDYTGRPKVPCSTHHLNPGSGKMQHI
jgi:hypothetical protein